MSISFNLFLFEKLEGNTFIILYLDLFSKTRTVVLFMTANMLINLSVSFTNYL